MKLPKLKRNPRRRRNPVPTGIILGTVIVTLGLAAFLIEEQKPKKKSNGGGNGDGTDGGDNSDDGGGGGDDNGTLPDYKPVPGEKWAKGPNGKGRVYGKPDRVLPDALFSSNKVLVDPSCQWVVEGEHFLPPTDHPHFGQEREHPTLFDTLQDDTNEILPIGAGANQAWGFVTYLIGNSNGAIDDATIMQNLFEEGAGLWKHTQNRGLSTAGLPVNGFVCTGVAEANLSQPLKNWRADMKTRVRSYLDAFFNVIPLNS